MDYILLTALVLFCIAGYFAIHFRSQLNELQNDYKLKNELIQSLERQRDIQSKDYYEMARQASAMQELARNIQENQKEALRIQEAHLRAEFELQAKSIRADAVQRAKVVNKGFDAETFSPLLQNKWNSKDFRHIGDPIDFLILSGAEDVRSDLQEEIDSVIILEVKTGNSDLNKVQRRIRDAIVAQRVQFALYNVDTKTIRIWSHDNPKGKNNEPPQESIS
jgi:predicted Holliday junction resolvase-like endonuclease